MRYLYVLVGLWVLASVAAADERVETLPFGDFEQWTVRYIQETGTADQLPKVLYTPAPTDTIREIKPYEYGKNGSPWATSNAYLETTKAKAGISNVRPEQGHSGLCCRMESIVDTLKVGRSQQKMFVAGMLFTGRTIEPMFQSGIIDPYARVDMGVPYTDHPLAMIVDYKALIGESGEMTEAKGYGWTSQVAGRDEAEIIVLFQKRWKDADGTIHARRVGTGCLSIGQSCDWQTNCRIDIHWGDARKAEGFTQAWALNQKPLRAMNHLGKLAVIQEDGYSIDKPTHMIILMRTSRQNTAMGCVGNTLWVDNIRFVFKND